MYMNDGLSKLTTYDMDKVTINDAAEIKEVPNNQLEALSETEQIEQISDYIEGLDNIKIENWEKLTLDERIDVLQSIENKTAEITGRSPLQVEATQLPNGVMGETNWFDKKIQVNGNLVASNNITDLRQCITTLAHEGRHAYQFSNLFEKRTEISDEKFNAWRVNVIETGYDSAYRMGYNRYFIQPIEVDARVFAEGVANKISFR